MFDVGALILEVVYSTLLLVWTCMRESDVADVSGAPKRDVVTDGTMCATYLTNATTVVGCTSGYSDGLGALRRS